MTRLRPLAALTLAALALAACSSAPAPAPTAAPQPSPSESPAAPPSPTTYLALGDSVAAGTGADVPAEGGYVPLLAARLRERLGCADGGAATGCPLVLRSLAVSGATTGTVLSAQVPAAVQALQEGEVGLVTVTVGGNDVFGPVLLSCVGDPAAPACTAAVDRALADADAGVDRVLGALAAAASEGTVLAVMTYYDPVPTCRLAPLAPLAARVLEGSSVRPGLNGLLRARAAEHGAVVVETGDRVAGPDDLVGGSDCLHPSGQGHAEIAAAFDDAVGERVAGL